MRDLSAVMEETADNSGLVDRSSGSEWQELLVFQESRIARWGEETVALETYVGKPHHEFTIADKAATVALDELPERHWNALQAVTLRTSGIDPQNDAALADRIFPPLSDMHTRYDQGGAGWEQLMTWPTLRDRRLSGGAITASNRNVETSSNASNWRSRHRNCGFAYCRST